MKNSLFTLLFVIFFNFYSIAQIHHAVYKGNFNNFQDIENTEDTITNGNKNDLFKSIPISFDITYDVYTNDSYALIIAEATNIESSFLSNSENKVYLKIDLKNQIIWSSEDNEFKKISIIDEKVSLIKETSYLFSEKIPKNINLGIILNNKKIKGGLEKITSAKYQVEIVKWELLDLEIDYKNLFKNINKDKLEYWSFN